VSDQDEPFKITGPSLDVDGRLVGRIEKVEQGPLPLDQQPPLELAERGPSHFDEAVTNFRGPQGLPPSQRFGRAVMVLALVLAAGLLAGGLLYKPRPQAGETVTAGGITSTFSGHRSAIIINSTPEGATVTIANQKVGVTPWAGDNIWGTGQVTLTLPGYKAWNGKLKAAEDTTLQVTLVAR
jgi:hypothetical protein